jgi:hypothetical protein
MSTPVITCRQLGPNNDPYWGQGQSNYLRDLAAVEQAIYTRLLLFQGEWWASTLDGLPLWQSILAQGASPRALQQMELIISSRILGTPYVISLSAVVTTFNASTRQYTYSATVQTQFGSVVITSTPTPVPGALP